MQHCKTSVAESHVWIEAAVADELGIGVCWDPLVDPSARRELQESKHAHFVISTVRGIN